MFDQLRMHVDAEHFGVHEERASLDWLDEGVLAKILSAFSCDNVFMWSDLFVNMSFGRCEAYCLGRS